MTQRLRVLAALPEDLALVSSTHIQWHNIVCGFSSGTPRALSSPPQVDALTHRYTKNKNKYFEKVPRGCITGPGNCYSPFSVIFAHLVLWDRVSLYS